MSEDGGVAVCRDTTEKGGGLLWKMALVTLSA